MVFTSSVSLHALLVFQKRSIIEKIENMEVDLEEEIKDIVTSPTPLTDNIVALAKRVNQLFYATSLRQGIDDAYTALSNALGPLDKNDSDSTDDDDDDDVESSDGNGID